VRIDTTVVHKPSDEIFHGYRTFFKMTFSQKPFDLIGNTINYNLKDKHPVLKRIRTDERNKPD